MDLIQMSQQMAEDLHKEALNAGKDNDPSYREGYLDCYNHIKSRSIVVPEIGVEVKPAWCNCNNREWDGEYNPPTCKNCGGEFD